MKFPIVRRRRLERVEARFREQIANLKRKLEKAERREERRREENEKFRRPKIFCVGLNKTGTTSLEKVFEQVGFSVGDCRGGEMLIEEWAERNFQPILEFCHTADAFQDCPFSYPHTFIALDIAFPNAKFILSTRDSAEQWWGSLTRFHSKLWADGNRVPSKEDLEKADYIYPGRPWRSNRLVYGTPEHDPYDRGTLLAHYERHNSAVQEYFRHRPEKLCVVNVAKRADYQKLCQFLEVQPKGEDFPWLNKT